MKLKILIFCILLASYCNAQTVTNCNNRITSLLINDEDSWIMKANNGNYYVAFFSDTLANPSILMTRSKNKGVTWDTTYVVMTSSDSCYYPSVRQTSNGMFHMTWFRIGATVDVWYSRSMNTFTWTTPVNLSNNSAVDWLGNLLVDNSDNLRVTFASDRSGNMDLYIINSTDGGSTWSTPLAITTHTAQDNLPYLFQTSSGLYVLAWQRYAGSPYSYLSNTSDIKCKTSSNCVTWSSEYDVTNDILPLKTDIFPGVYQNPSNSDVFITWTSDRIISAGNNIEVKLAAILGTDTAKTPKSITCNGYYARVIPADTLGQFITTWVANPNNDMDREIYCSFLKKGSVTNLKEYENNITYQFAPNPFETTAELTLNASYGNYTITIYDCFGKQVRKQDIIGNRTIIEKNSLNNGLYFFSIKGLNETNIVGKFIIE